MMCDAKRFFLLTCFLVSSTSEDIKVKPGDDVLLQCQGSRGAVVKLLEWSKPDVKSGGYVFYFKNGKQDGDFQHQSFHGRVELKDPEMKGGDVSVTLKNVTVNDTGTYECRVGNGQDVQLISIIHLTVEPGTNKDGGDKSGHVGLIVGLLVVLLIVAVVGFVIYRKCKVKNQNSNPPAGEQTGETQMFQV